MPPRPAVHDDAIPSPAATSPAPSAPARPRPPAAAASARADRARPAIPQTRGSRAPSRRLAWLPYLIVLAGVAAGMFVIWQGSKYAGRGAGIIGASLLAGALARLILPARYAGLLSSRRKASDVLAFAVFGAAVLAVAIALP